MTVVIHCRPHPLPAFGQMGGSVASGLYGHMLPRADTPLTASPLACTKVLAAHSTPDAVSLTQTRSDSKTAAAAAHGSVLRCLDQGKPELCLQHVIHKLCMLWLISIFCGVLVVMQL